MSNNYLFRYQPCSFSSSIAKRKDTKEIELKYEQFGESITDKESYKLNISSQRGLLGSVNGSPNISSYMFPDGKYDVHKDFSYILRKDLSIVEIDEYTNLLKCELEQADEDLKADIKSQIKAFEDKKLELSQKGSDQSSNDHV